MDLSDTTNSSDQYDYDYEAEEPCLLGNNRNAEQVLRPYIHPVICVLGFAGNGLVILTYAFCKRTRSPTDVYLLNMAASDLLFVAVLPLITYNEHWAWPMGTAACKLLRGAYTVNVYSCMLLLACISADRYFAIVHARRSFRLRSLLYSRAACAVVWVLSVAFSLPTFVFYQVYQPSHQQSWEKEGGGGGDGGGGGGGGGGGDGGGGDWVCNMRFSDRRTAKDMKVMVPSSQMALGFFLPLGVMIFCYAQVVATLLRANTFQRHRAVRVVLAVVVVFLVCHLPYNVMLLYDTLGLFQPQGCQQMDMLQVGLTVTETVAYLHCCVNPLLYAFLGVKFRNNVKKVMRELWRLSRGGSRRGSRTARRSLSSRATSDSFAPSRRSINNTSFDI
ncbi:unnamed protein product [Lota lota]